MQAPMDTDSWLESATATMLPTVAATAALVYGTLAAAHTIFLGSAAQAWMVPLAGGTAVVGATLWTLARQGSLTTGNAVAGIGLLLALALANTAAQTALELRPGFALHFAVLTLAAAALVPRAGWLVGAFAVEMTCWLWIARDQLSSPGWRDATSGILFAIAISGVVFAARHRSARLLLDSNARQRELAEELESRRLRLREFSTLLDRLIRTADSLGGDLATTWTEITETAARGLSVARAGVWLLSKDGATLRCGDLYRAKDGHHERGSELETTGFPAYARALQEVRAIDAHDAAHDPRTCELADGYLTPLGISSMLDAPIVIDGRVIGVVCVEHVGPTRQWDEAEIAFAGSLAGVASSALQANERTRLEARMREAIRLESLGALAGGVAHDFNNVLAALAGNLELIGDGIDGKAHDELFEMRAAVERGRELARQMLAYAGRAPFEVGVVDLDAIVAEVLPVVSAPRDGEPAPPIRLEASDRRVAAFGDATQLRQIVQNLLTNARDALVGRRGEIVVRTGVKTMGAEQLSTCIVAEAAEPGDFAFVEVEDEGLGMDPSSLERIFDPFFTTKAGGRGLGLAAVRGIVRAHAGAITAESELGRGSAIRLLLPATDEATAAPTISSAPQVHVAEGRTVLLVEDDPAVRRVAARALASGGFAVVEATACSEALAVFEASDQIDAAVVDLNLADGSGAPLLTELGRRGLDALLLTSGDVSPGSVAGAHFLPKPYSRAELLSAVAAALSESESKPETPA